MSEALFRSANEMDIRSMTSTFWPLLLDLPHRCFMGVKKLALSQAIFDSPDPFITLIALLPSLEQLELNFVVFRSGNTESKGISQPKKLRKLKLIMGAAGDILWLFQPCKTIEEFVAEVNKEQALSYVNSFLASSLAVKNGTLAHCTLRPNIPRSQRDLRKEIDFFLDPGPHFTIEGELSNLLVIFNNFGPRSPSHSPSKLTRIILHDVNAAVYRGRNRLHVFPSFDGWLAKDAFFQSLEEVWLQVSETFRKEVLIMAGWNESAMTVDEGSIPHVVMQDRIREVEELLPRCKRRGILKIKAVYMTGSF
ncbi:hypothetical protein VNI00_002872 [Paramarasmius palmivorus]|uniref:F-box protein n=1 Tax=Paramarasmius palmivorus TaxID=297713 RepID=A0AAW0DZ92_9AGAR